MRVKYWSSTGAKLFLANIIFTYVLQLLLYYFVHDDIKVYKFSDPSLFFYMSLLVFSLAFIAITYQPLTLAKLDLSSKLLVKFCILLGKAMKIFWFKYRGLHVLLFFGAAILWFRSGLANYRYDGVRMNERMSPELIIGMVWKFFFYYDFWYHISLGIVKKKVQEYKYKYMINISFLLLLTGTTSALFYIVHLVVVFFPNFFHKAIQVSIMDTFRKRPWRVFKYVSIMTILSGFLLCAYHYGEIIKTGKEMTISERFESKDSKHFLTQFFVERFSTTLYGHTLLLDEIGYDIDDYVDHMSIPVTNFLYRLNVVTGRQFDYKKPKIASINQLNYLVTSATKTDKTSGASPGLIPGFMYFFPPWVAMLVSALFLAKIAILLNLFLPKSTFLFATISMLLLLDLFKALILVFNPLSTTSVQIFFFLGLVGLLYQKKVQNDKKILYENMASHVGRTDTV